MALSHVTIFGTNLVGGLQGSGDHVGHGVHVGLAYARQTTRAAKHRVADKVDHPTGHNALEKRAPAVFLVSRARARPVGIREGDRCNRTSRARASRCRQWPQTGWLPRQRDAGHRRSGNGVDTDDVCAFDTTHREDRRSRQCQGAEPSRRPVRSRPGTRRIRAAPPVPPWGVGDPRHATAGMSLNGTLTARDAYGNTVTGFDGNVTLTGDDGQPVHSAAQTAFTNGMEILAVALNVHDPAKREADGGKDRVTERSYTLLAIESIAGGCSNPKQAFAFSPRT